MGTEHVDVSAESASKAWLSGPDQAMYAWALGDLMSFGVPILDCFGLCGEVFSHPRLRWLSKLSCDLIREGDCLAQAWRHESMRGALDPMVVTLVDVGEETGDLDRALKRYATRALRDSSATLGQVLGRNQVLMDFLEHMEMQTVAGLPILRGLRIIQMNPHFEGAAAVVKEIANKIEHGFSLYEACSKAGTAEGGAVSLRFDPLSLAMIASGEKGGVLDVAFQRLVGQNSPLR